MSIRTQNMTGLLPRRFLVSYKLLPPQPTLNEVPRERIEALYEANVPVTLVDAPAGYGKTTALAQWFRNASAEGLKVSWITFEEEDQDAVLMLSYISAALGVPEKSILQDEASENEVLSLAEPLSDLLDWVQEQDQTMVLFLDDLQRAHSKDSAALLEELINHLPTNLRVVLAVRGAPPCSLAELRFRGEVNEIGYKDLLFTQPEAKALFKGRLSDEKVNDLLDRAEGWPIALQLIGLWLRGRTEFSDIKSLSGRSKVLSEYLAEQVIKELPEDIQSFLMATAILERVSGDVACALTDREDAWLLLEELERRNLFLVPLDQDRNWYRYHQLFAQFLEGRMERSSPGADQDLHKRAAFWFAENGHVQDAIRHAMKVTDVRFVAQFVDTFGGIELALRTETRALCGIEKVALPVSSEYPRFHLLQMYFLLQHNRTDEAWGLFEALRINTDNFREIGPGARFQVSVIDFLLRLYKDLEITPQLVVDMEELLDASKTTVPDILRPPVAGIVCCANYHVSSYSKSRAWGTRAIAECRTFGATYAENYSRFFIGQAAMAQGQLGEAEDRYQEALDHAENYFGRDGNQALTSRILLAEVRYEQNRLSEAGDLMAELPAPEELVDSWFSIYSSLYLTLSSLYARRWSVDAGLAVLERAGEMASQRGLERLQMILNIHAVRELTRVGRSNDAQIRLKRPAFQDLLQTCNSFDSRFRQLHETAVEADAALRILDGDGAGALELLRPIAERAGREGRLRRLMKSQVMQAVAHEIAGDHGQALGLFRQAVKLAAPEGYMRTFIDEGPYVRRLALDTLALKNGLSPCEGSFLKEVARAETPDGRKEADSANGDKAVHLSPREQEVLESLNCGYSNKEIANAFGLSESTIKFYRRNLYRKLDVQTRAQAIAKGRNLTLL